MCEECHWADALDDLRDMLADPRYDFSKDFLTSVAEWVEEKEHITPKQVVGIQNIQRAAKKDREPIIPYRRIE